uniref:Reverse transcriptase domain-containing protein n=1 Tax=Oreochromis niloticus TaxID=8128 RepID=A0A669C5X4_ORENI
MTSLDTDYRFPFRDIEEEDFDYEKDCQGGYFATHAEKMNFKMFNYAEHNMHDPETNIDPDNYFYNNNNSTCEYYTDDQFNMNIKMANALSVIHFNSRSLYKNFSKITECLSKLKKFNIIAISETWLDNEKVSEMGLEGYELFTMNRVNKKGGGVALYVDKVLKCSLIECMSSTIDDVLECVTIEIHVEKASNIIISCIYRTPGSCLDTFNEKLAAMFSNLNDKKVQIICGDFNIDLLNPNGHQKTTDFISTMYSNCLFPVIIKPSRITIDTATLIDNIFTNKIDHEIVGGLLITDISDHLPVFAIFQNYFGIKTKKKNQTFDMIRHRTTRAIAALQADLKEHNWNEVFANEDSSSAYDAFLSTVISLYEKHCPLMKITRKHHRSNKPWITKGIEDACKMKNNLYKRFIKLRTKDAEIKYKLYKNRLVNIIRTSKKEYYHTLLEQNRSNTQETWRILNSIIKKGSKNKNYPDYFKKDKDIVLDKTKDIVNEFNDFFVNVGFNLAKEIPESRNNNDLNKHITQNVSSMFIGAVTHREIINIVKTFKNKKSTDCFGIDMKLVKSIIEYIVQPFAYICNLSFRTGVFPSQMKTAKVIPIHKNGERCQFTNYRPISLLPQFSKILEKLFVNRLDKYIEKHNLLSDNQYGFRVKRSTSMAVMELVEGISNAIDNKEYTVGVFIDLKKAFDTIDHSILMNKLERYGIRGIAYKWMKSYLDDRYQYVEINNVKSNQLKVTCGVPQGSVLGPKLFILYINDICSVSKLLKCVLFADDTTLYCSGKDLEQLLTTVEKELNILKNWFDVNKLSLNIKKTKLIIFGTRQMKNVSKIRVNGIEIERVFENKFLGVLIDDKLSWKSHINHVTTKMSKTIAILYKTKHVLNKKSLYTLYCSLLLPYMTYCLEIWGNAYKTNTLPIFKLQKRAIRIINQSNYIEPTNILFINLNTLKFYDLVEYKMAQIMYKAQNNLLCRSIQKLFKVRESQYDLRGTDVFKTNKIRTNIKQRCVSVRGVNLWNSYDNDLKRCSSFSLFKNMFKNRVLEKYINQE